MIIVFVFISDAENSAHGPNSMCTFERHRCDTLIQLALGSCTRTIMIKATNESVLFRTNQTFAVSVVVEMIGTPSCFGSEF